MEQLNLTEMFTSFYVTTQLSLDNDKLKKLCMEIIPDVNKNSGRLDLNDERFAELKYKVLEKANIIHRKLGLSQDYEQEIWRYWANLDRAYAAMEPHCHPDGFFSAVYYPSVENDSTLRIMNPVREIPIVVKREFVSEQNKYWSQGCRIQPTAGMLVIFPSWLYHYIENESYKNTGDRISIAFDTRVVKKVLK
jgi:uncharacterized protein (TIGR02466 family)